MTGKQEEVPVPTRTDNAGHKFITKTYTIEASPDMLNQFERLLAHAQYCSGVGHSTNVAMCVDGDGADRFKVLRPDVRKFVGGKVQEFHGGQFEILGRK